MRLIDADEFFERMKNDTDLCAEMEMCGEKALKKYLDLQPTAYDVDEVVEELERYPLGNLGCQELNKIIEIVKQEAEQYEECDKDCGQCEAYDKQKHYCPKWCDVIKGTVAEIEENHSNDFCEWKEKSVGGIELVREPHRMKLFHIEEERKFCPYCGKKIKVVD